VSGRRESQESYVLREERLADRENQIEQTWKPLWQNLRSIGRLRYRSHAKDYRPIIALRYRSGNNATRERVAERPASGGDHARE
jgi:hypothetical protein